MPPPSQLAIATSSLNRLVKEEASYHKELEQQQSRIAKLESNPDSENENAEYELRQEKKAAEETKAVFPQMKTKITEAKEKLDEQLASGEEHSPEEITKAKEAAAAAMTAMRETS
ncbi:hypothetical protein MBLNU230_g0856t1 [Neophaeotheca triangularis]